MFATETKEVTLYSYDENGVFSGEFDYLWVVGTGLAANSTFEKPLIHKDDYVSVWNGMVWEYQENHIGKTIYSIINKSSKVVGKVGDIDDGYTLLVPNNFDTWSGSTWVDIRTAEEVAVHRRSLLPSLTCYQFKRCLLENGYKTSDIESKILTIKDEMTRELTLLGFKEATNFVRTDDSILAMQSMLKLSDDKVDELWVYAMAL